MIVKLREKKVLKFIADSVARGLGFRTIAKELKRKYNIDAVSETVQEVYESYIKMAGDSMKTVEKEVNEHIIDVGKQLKKINKITNELLDKYYTYEKEDDPNSKKVFTLLSIMQAIQGHIMIQERILERLQKAMETSKGTTINHIHLTKIMINNLKEWEKMGMIEIKKMPNSFKNLEEEVIENE